jgi:zinc transporter ZupT
MSITTILLTVALGVAAATAEVIGGFVVAGKRLVSQRLQGSLMALGAGFLLALVFTELIPASIHALGSTAMLYMLFGYSTLHFFEHTVVKHLHFGEETHHEVMLSKLATYSAIAGLLVHAFFDGMSIAVGVQMSERIGMLVFVAVLLHKFPEGITTASILLASAQPRKTAARGALLVGLATLVGILASLVLHDVNPAWVSGVFAFSAGTATYVGASDLVPEVNRSGTRATPVAVFAGMMLFYLTSRLVEMFIGTA